MKKSLLIISILLSGYIFAQNEANTAVADSEPLVTIHAEETHLPTVLAILAKESGYNIVTGPLVSKQDKLSIHLDDVPISQAINLVVRAVGLSYEIIDNSILVAREDQLSKEVGINSYVIDLQYANAEEIKELLVEITEQIGRASCRERV